MSLRGAVEGSCLLTCAVSAAWATGVRLNLSESIPLGIYRQHAATGAAIGRGAIVLACLPVPVAMYAHRRGYLPRGNCASGTMPVGKIVVAIAGDTVVVSNAGIAVNGAMVPNSRPLARDRVGRPLPRHSRGRFVVAIGSVWLGSRSGAGFDSRYFGAVPTSGIRATLTRF